MKKQKTYKEDLVREVTEDFLARQKARKSFESQWNLNINFLLGNQYSYLNSLNEVEDSGKQYFWQEREVFNHVAPIVEARLAKLSTIMPQMEIVPASSEESDLKVARLSRDILKGAYQKLNLKSTIAEATKWSEITGTSFYKIVWNDSLGKSLYIDNSNKKIKEGDVEVVAIPPYEIYPENNGTHSLGECYSLIHAKAYHVRDVKNIWGVDVDGSEVGTYSIASTHTLGGLGYRAGSTKIENDVRPNHAIVIERYESPSQEFPNGRLVIVCQDKLLYLGELPFINLPDGQRGFPFVKQVSMSRPGCFWGSSVIERIIPIQRAFNAVKNRKHEYLNRLSMGVLTIEDGSVDVENLEEEGLSPGKVLVYRQGSTPPKIIEPSSMPNDFEKEEEQLLSEFCEISGVSNVITNSSWSRSLSGTALELMVEQDSARLASTAENIRSATTEVAKQILKLYKQFATTPRLVKTSNNSGESEVYFWKDSDLSCDEVQFVANDEGESLTTKREQILKLLSHGLLSNEENKISGALKVKILELFGLGVWDGNVDEDVLQKNYADDENLKLLNGHPVEVLEIDNHDLHISRHISFMLDKTYQNALKKNPSLKDKFLQHIRAHKQAKS